MSYENLRGMEYLLHGYVKSFTDSTTYHNFIRVSYKSIDAIIRILKKEMPIFIYAWAAWSLEFGLSNSCEQARMLILLSVYLSTHSAFISFISSQDNCFPKHWRVKMCPKFRCKHFCVSKELVSSCGMSLKCKLICELF